jgi:hypothetical protein
VPSAPWLPTKHDGTKITWANLEDDAKYAASQEWIWSKVDYTRKTASFPQNTIFNCEAYTYRSFYDIERWIDATNACKGQPRCIVDITMHGMGAKSPATAPGIARRSMRDSESALISTRLDKLVGEGLVAQIESDPFNDDLYQLDEVPKNAFYANTKWFMVPALVNAFQPTGQDQIVGALLDELSRGEQLYVAGKGSPTVSGVYFQDAKGNPHQGFFDEWDFHRVLNNRTKKTTEGEQQEYRRRQKEFTTLFDKLIDEWKCLVADAQIPGGCQGLDIPNAIGKVHPGDTQMWEGDPFASRSLYGKVDGTALVVPPFINGNIGFGADLQQTQFGALSTLTAGQITQLGSMLTQGVKAIPFKAHMPGLLTPRGRNIGTVIAWDNGQVATQRGQNAWLGNLVPHVDPASLVPEVRYGEMNAAVLITQTWTTNPPKADLTSATPRLDCTVRGTRIDGGGEVAVGGVLRDPLGGLKQDKFHTERIWKDVCLLTNLLLEEWGRTQKGHSSCIDRTNSACDWMPQDFVDRFYTRNIGWAAAAKESEFKYCKRWTGGNKMTSQKNDVKQVGIPSGERTNVADIRAFLALREAAFLKLFKKVPVLGKDDFGTVRADDQHIGDKKFGGGFAYSLGWHAQVKKRDAADQICRLGGNASATMTAEAILFGHHNPIIDGLAMVSANEDDDGKAYGNAHLYVMGSELFDTKDAPASFHPDPVTHRIDISATYNAFHFDGDRITLFAVPFQAGPITITITVGLDYKYGFTAGFQAGGPPADKNDPNYCNASAYLYKATATFTPQADLGAWLDADASFLGFGVGLEVELTLVGIGLPLFAEVKLGVDAGDLAILFQAGLDLDLVTLKGQMSVYVKAFFVKIFSVKLVDWDGFHHKFPVFRTPLVAVPLTPLVSDVILPIGSDKNHNWGAGSETL